MGKFTQNQWNFFTFGTTLSLFLITISYSLFALYVASGGEKLSASDLHRVLICALVAFALGFLGLLIMIALVGTQAKNPKDTTAIPNAEIKIILDFTKMTPKQIAALMNELKNMSSAQIETLLGGQYAKVIKETAKYTKGKAAETSSKTEKAKKNGRT